MLQIYAFLDSLEYLTTTYTDVFCLSSVIGFCVEWITELDKFIFKQGLIDAYYDKISSSLKFYLNKYSENNEKSPQKWAIISLLGYSLSHGSQDDKLLQKQL